MKLIVGLGNPGKEYSTNRHNIGFLCISRFAKINKISLDKKQSQARTGRGRISGNDVVLAKPQTYMNASGCSLRLLMQKHNISLEDLIIIHDDLDFPLGKIRIRKGGSAGGHNGIKSAIANLGTQDFIRIRVGIGRPQAETSDKDRDVVDYVLGDFSPDEKAILEETLHQVCDATLCLITEGLKSAMNKYNSSPEQPPGLD
jgi:PTH1 family peptidyl-tRNA hydrolase